MTLHRLVVLWTPRDLDHPMAGIRREADRYLHRFSAPNPFAVSGRQKPTDPTDFLEKKTESESLNLRPSKNGLEWT